MSAERRAEAAGHILPVEEGFNIKRPLLTPRRFEAEKQTAFAPTGPSAVIDLDCSATLGTDWPATTPTMLASYVRLAGREPVTQPVRAAGVIVYVSAGEGETAWDGGTLAWSAGDLFCLPGGGTLTHAPKDDRAAVLYVVSDAPLLHFLAVEPTAHTRSPIEPVLYRADRLTAELEALRKKDMAPDAAGRAIFLTSRSMRAQATCFPDLTLTLNTVLPGERQTPHRHNAAALVYILEGGPVVSRIGNQDFPWDQDSVLLTPPMDVHSHHNGGEHWATALIVQDGGLHYHTRTMGFSVAN